MVVLEKGGVLWSKLLGFWVESCVGQEGIGLKEGLSVGSKDGVYIGSWVYGHGVRVG
jgi:hypothetical protein